MSEESSNFAAEISPLLEIRLADLIGKEGLQPPGVRIYETNINAFFQWLKDAYTQKTQGQLGCTIAACIGGAIRSAQINECLDLLGFSLPKELPVPTPAKGVALSNLAIAICEGRITEAGEIIPRGFNHPINTLIVPRQPGRNEGDNLALVVSSIKCLAEKKGVTRINFNVLMFPGSEDDLPDKRREIETFLDHFTPGVQ